VFAARCCAQLCKQALAFMVRLVQVILHTCVLAGAASGDVVVGAAHSLTSAEAFILMPSHCSCASELFLIVCVRVCVCVCVCRAQVMCGLGAARTRLLWHLCWCLPIPSHAQIVSQCACLQRPSDVVWAGCCTHTPAVAPVLVPANPITCADCSSTCLSAEAKWCGVDWVLHAHACCGTCAGACRCLGGRGVRLGSNSSSSNSSKG